MKRSKRNEIIKQLRAKGFKMVKGYHSLYVNREGKVYNLSKERYLTNTPKNYVITNKKRLNVAKLILQAFKGIEYRKGQILHIDGNEHNINPENIKYKSLFAPDHSPDPISESEMIKAIRCYFQVKKDFTTKDILQTKMYLRQITTIRAFFVDHYNAPHIEVFKTYLLGEGIHTYQNPTILDTAHQCGLNFRDCHHIINGFKNTLIKEILQDLNKGTLTVKDLFKPLTKTEILKNYNKELIKRGTKPLPLRKKSLNERLKDFDKQTTSSKDTLPQ